MNAGFFQYLLKQIPLILNLGFLAAFIMKQLHVTFLRLYRRLAVKKAETVCNTVSAKKLSATASVKVLPGAECGVMFF